MTPTNIVTLTVAFINFLLGGIIYIHSQRRAKENIFALIAFSTSIWCLGTFLMTTPIASNNLYILGAVLHYIFGNLVFLLLFWFVYYFPKPTERSLLLPIIATLIDCAFFVAIIFTQFLFKEFLFSSPGGPSIVFNAAGYFIYAVFILALFVVAEVTLLYKYKMPNIEKPEHVKYVILGTGIASVPALVSNLVLPGFHITSFFAIGPIFAVPWVLIIGYAIFKHNLLNIKIIATEFFITLIIAALALEVFLATTDLEFLLRFVMLIAVSFFSYLLIRSVLKEVKTRLQIEELAGKLRDANTELERVNQAKSDFLSITSHQLKTPLSIIKGYVSMALEGSFGAISENLQKQLNKVYVSNERLITLVDDLLNLSRIEEGRMQYDWTIENVGEIVTSVVDEVSESAVRKGVAISWKEPQEALRVKVDRNKIRNVIFNLLDNALKYTEKGKVTIHLVEGDGYIELRVTDTGKGIHASELPKLFTKFSRVRERHEGNRRYNVAGFGLGLYVARLIVEAHGGTTWADSKGEGKGSTFFIKLPLAKKGNS
ncbi:MAG: histidine kinase [Parcubacteria group bacterium Gr01-1014_70]|nr:MAG: histidine kinase [Parcubacteria group bacterium Gr01-1014_70]